MIFSLNTNEWDINKEGVTMFEKEAEENGFGIGCTISPTIAWQKGAEFGYKKANEWHFVKDEGTPKVEGHYLVCLRNKDKDVFDCWIYYEKDVGWCSMKVRMKDIYAWKEIVHPVFKGE